MLSNKFWGVLTLLSAIIFSSCSDDADKNVILWGGTDAYDKFWWHEQVPDTLRQVIVFEFNDDAKSHLNEALRFGFFKKSEDGKMAQVKADEAEIFLNGKRAENNEIAIMSSENEAEIGIVFNPSAEYKVHYWYLLAIDATGLTRINDNDILSNANEPIMEIKVDKNEVMNPLKKWVLWFLAAVGAGMVVRFCWGHSRPKFADLTLRIDDKPYKIKNAGKYVLSSIPRQQSFLHRVFNRRIDYYKQNWVVKDNDIIIKPYKIGKDRGIKVFLSNAYSISNSIITKGKESILKVKSTGKEIKISINKK